MSTIGYPNTILDLFLVTVNVTETGEYALQVNGVTWLQNAPTFFNENGTKYSTEDGSLNLTTQLTTYNGADRLGDFIAYKFQYTASSGQMLVTIKDYSPQPYVIFEQVWIFFSHQNLY